LSAWFADDKCVDPGRRMWCRGADRVGFSRCATLIMQFGRTVVASHNPFDAALLAGPGAYPGPMTVIAGLSGSLSHATSRGVDAARRISGAAVGRRHLSPGTVRSDGHGLPLPCP
jgi:hypothetical protein